MEKVTVRTRIDPIRESYREFSEEDLRKVKHFLCDEVYELYARQHEQNPHTDFYMVALKYEGIIDYCQVMTWDFESTDFVNVGEYSNVEKRLMKLICKEAYEQEMRPISKEEAIEGELIPKKESKHEKWWMRKRKEEDLLILLLDYRPKNQGQNLQKETG